MISPLSDGNADGISGSSKETVVKDGPHAGETAEREDQRYVGHVCFIDRAP